MGGTGSGGPRTPSAPAPVSGPGRLSKRTDGGPGAKIAVPSGLPYGDRQDITSQERSAPMALEDKVPNQTGSHQQSAGDAGFQGLGFDAPTTKPNEPVTHGAGYGPGGGLDVLSGQPAPPTGAMTQMLSKLSATQGSGLMAQLLQQAAARNL